MVHPYMQNLAHVYYFPIDADGNEVAEPIPVTIFADGSADISQLPEPMQKTFLRFGVPDELHQQGIFPREGERFLKQLLASANAYVRFRSSPEKH